MLKERLELIEHEIEKVTRELTALYSQIAIKGDTAPANEALYDTKKGVLSDLMHDKIEILALLDQERNV